MMHAFGSFPSPTFWGVKLANAWICDKKKHIISLPFDGFLQLRLWQGTSGLHCMYCVNQLVQGVRLRELNVVACGSLISAVKLEGEKNGSVLGSFLEDFS